ncbi:hypothetical protein GIB67_031532 [Kingdonia uniflora]|uniref:Pectinesterase n=1 Tax=Kingdonia uniflora TaxID=39325 RepID=A0A7J7PB98_9MAGN|nr:hypothetical protein GIB67_031532 [Kingdonia uniflora]
MANNKGYGHVAGDAGNGGVKKKRVLLISISSVVLVAMVVAVAVSVKRSNDGSTNSSGGSDNGEIKTSMKAIEAICQPTTYKQTCVDSLSSAAGNTSDPKELVKIAFKVAMDHIANASEHSSTIQQLAKDPGAKQALKNCRELMGYSIDDLQNSFDKVSELDITKFDEVLAELETWLTASKTYQETCQDGFENTTGNAGESMRKALTSSVEVTSNALNIVSKISTVLTSLQIPFFNRRLLSEESEDGFPSWVSEEKRQLLAAAPASIKADVIIAQDGSGKYKTINEAIKDIPLKSSKTFVIYIKAGNYKERVELTKAMHHVMMIGDGPTKTKITGSLNFVDGVRTYNTATVALMGPNFIAKDLGFENSAGAAKHQAVALRAAGDMSIFYNCQMDAYQDTLYAHASRQFYRKCTISGTIDFVFGNAAAVFQDCTFMVRKPMENQQCIVTAQGRKEKAETSGFVIQDSHITADPLLDIKLTKSYLGRPWKLFSRTVIINTEIDALIAPEGWLPWAGSYALDTLFYSEVGNTGPGAALTGRVKWPGIMKITPAQLPGYLADGFIQGNQWVAPTGIPYSPGLTKKA